MANAADLDRAQGSTAGDDLSNTDLSGGDLTGLTWISVYLAGANLSGADFGSSELSDVNLSGANLRGTNLSRARELYTANMAGAEYDATTQWPEGFDPTERGAVMV